MIRTYSSTDPVRNPDPATDPVAYNKICQQTPTAPDCGLPLYWPAPPQVLKTTAGMHRFTWDMHYDPIPGGGGGGRGGGGGGGAVPHRTYPGVNSPWVAPGAYTVRLTANGQSLTQPITVKMDPRVKITPEVQQIFTLTTQMETPRRDRRRSLQGGARAGGQAEGAAAIGRQRCADQASGRDRARRRPPATAAAVVEAAAAWWRWRRIRRCRPNRRLLRHSPTSAAKWWRGAGDARLGDAAHRGATPGLHPAGSRLHGLDGEVGRAEGEGQRPSARRREEAVGHRLLVGQALPPANPSEARTSFSTLRRSCRLPQHIGGAGDAHRRIK